jgi:hypothetical protein
MATDLRHRLRQLDRPKGVNFVLGLWLIVSTFVFPQTSDGALVSWIAGALIAISSAAAFVAGGVRYIDALLAVLLAVAALVLPAASAATRINELCVAAAVLVFALVRDDSGMRPLHPHLRRG